MESLLSYLLFLGLILGVHSAVFYERQRLNGHGGQCYDPKEDKYYNPGEEMKWNFKSCGRKLCRGSVGKDSSFVEMHTCIQVSAEAGCRLEANLSLPYPGCCPRAVCPDKSPS